VPAGVGFEQGADLLPLVGVEVAGEPGAEQVQAPVQVVEGQVRCRQQVEAPQLGVLPGRLGAQRDPPLLGPQGEGLLGRRAEQLEAQLAVDPVDLVGDHPVGSDRPEIPSQEERVGVPPAVGLQEDRVPALDSRLEDQVVALRPGLLRGLLGRVGDRYGGAFAGFAHDADERSLELALELRPLQAHGTAELGFGVSSFGGLGDTGDQDAVAGGFAGEGLERLELDAGLEGGGVVGRAAGEQKEREQGAEGAHRDPLARRSPSWGPR
jgi:hypothetical protein